MEFRASSFCPVCLSATLWLWQKKTNFGHNFWTLRVKTSYLACILNKWNPFKWSQDQDLVYDNNTKNSQLWTLLLPGHWCFTNTLLFFCISILLYSTHVNGVFINCSLMHNMYIVFMLLVLVIGSMYNINTEQIIVFGGFVLTLPSS